LKFGKRVSGTHAAVALKISALDGIVDVKNIRPIANSAVRPAKLPIGLPFWWIEDKMAIATVVTVDLILTRSWLYFVIVTCCFPANFLYFKIHSKYSVDIMLPASRSPGLNRLGSFAYRALSEYFAKMGGTLL
jgi:hypothetical protein